MRVWRHRHWSQGAGRDRSHARKGTLVGYDTEAVCDYYLGEFRALEEQFLRDDAGRQTGSLDLSKRLVELCDHLARRLQELASATRPRDVGATVRAHPLHREVILQSS